MYRGGGSEETEVEKGNDEEEEKTNKQTNSPSLPELECFSVSTLDLQPLAGLYFSFLFYILVFGGKTHDVYSSASSL